MKPKKINGAGLVLISRDTRKVFVLWNGEKLDLPKGSIERGESSIEAAFREAREEAGINKEDCELISSLPGTFENIQFYYAFWDGVPSITPNPKTGIFEHDRAEWVRWKKALDASPDFLKPALFHGLALIATLPRRRK